MLLTKRKTLTASLAIALVAILAFGSLAYFTAQASVKGKFMIASTSEETTARQDLITELAALRDELQALVDGGKGEDKDTRSVQWAHLASEAVRDALKDSAFLKDASDAAAAWNALTNAQRLGIVETVLQQKNATDTADIDEKLSSLEAVNAILSDTTRTDDQKKDETKWEKLGKEVQDILTENGYDQETWDALDPDKRQEIVEELIEQLKDEKKQKQDESAIFSITLSEPMTAKGVILGGASNVASNGEGGYIYSNVAPGVAVSKDPTVTNTGSYNAYIRAEVVFSNASAWAEAMNGKDLATTVLTLTDGWTVAGNPTTNTDDDTITYVYYLEAPLAPTDTAQLFSAVTMPKDLTISNMLALAEFGIDVTAYAIQSDNLPEGYTTAQAAFNLAN